MNRYPWVLFDVDNTLLASSSYDALQEAFSTHATAFRKDIHQTFLKINACLWEQYQQGRISSTQVTIQRFIDLSNTIGTILDPSSFSVAYANGLVNHVRLNPGAKETLADLSQGSTLVAASNGVSAVQKRKLRQAKIDQYFEHIIISEDVGTPKPLIGFFEALHTAIGEPAPSSMIIIGDSHSSDIEGGSRFGIDTCWYNPRGKERPIGTEPTYEIRNLLELCDLVKQA